MTLEEAKERIKQAAEESRRDYNTYGDEHVKGEEYGLRHALSILKHVDTEPAQKDKMTLTELAYVLRKFFRFNYLTYHGNVYDECDICLWEVKPTYCDISWRISPDESCMVIYPEFLTMNLDLSEYKDEDGNIDYSKCIVEVE